MKLHAVNFGRNFLLKRWFLAGIWVILRGFFVGFLDKKERIEPIILVRLRFEKPPSRAKNRINDCPKLQSLNLKPYKPPNPQTFKPPKHPKPPKPRMLKVSKSPFDDFRYNSYLAGKKMLR